MLPVGKEGGKEEEGCEESVFDVRRLNTDVSWEASADP